MTKQVGDRQRPTLIKGQTKEHLALVLPGGSWQTHDLRRTGDSQMAEGHAVLHEVIERCLNNAEQSKVKRIYQRAPHRGR